MFFTKKTFVICLFIMISNLNSYEFTFEPIDAVIPCHKKDKRTIDLVIEGIRKNVKNVRRIIVISKSKLTDKAEWFDEKKFPFSKWEIACEIFHGNEKNAKEFIQSKKTRIGWIYQQFLKFYSMFVIPNISSNMLIVDADTIFLRPIEFQDPTTAAGLYNTGTENHCVYFDHLKKVIPGFKRLYSEHSGICHHMLFQRSVLQEIFEVIESYNNVEPWRAFCRAIDKNHLYASCMCVEYELYFNYVFSRNKQVKIRPLKYKDISFIKFDFYKNQNIYDYLSCHTYIE